MKINEMACVIYHIKLLEILFDNNFLALGNGLQTELISDTKDNKTTAIHGSDITDPITGTYQVAGNGSI